MAHSILIVGGNSGIGSATARRLKAGGHRLLVTSRRPEDTGGEMRFDALDPAPLDLPERLDGLVYFPGTITLKPFHRLGDEDFLTDFRINCLGAVSVLRSALPALKRSDVASVVLFSSVAAAQGMPFHASVSAAKGAVEGLARSLAAELAPKVRVNVVAPSLTDTPLASGLLDGDAKREASENRHPLRRVGDAEDVAALVEFLLSDRSKFMSGQVLRPDGGLSTLRPL